MTRYFDRPVLLNRQGAAVVAVNAVIAEMDELPKNISLISYRRGFRYDEHEPPIGRAGHIDDAPPSLDLSLVKHVFEIEAESVRFLVEIDGKTAKVRQI